MNPKMEKHRIFDSSDREIFIYYTKYRISYIIDLNNGKELISLFDEIDKDFTKSLNISIPISLAVTAYARIFMSQFKK
jgi:hypothetical protein